VPGINGFADDGIGNSRISISIRGLNPRRSSRVLILEDGVPIQPALYVYPNMYYNPPADRIDQIEVIKGSGSILYGPQTMGGVINYFTKRPRNEFGGLFKVTAGENGYQSFFTEIGGWGNGKLKPEIQFLVKRGDGFRMNNGFEQINGTLKLNYRPSTHKNIYMKANVNYENSNATYTGLTKIQFDTDPTFNPKDHDMFKVFRSAFDYIETEKLSSSLLKTTTIFGSYFDRRWWRENDIFVRADYDSASNQLTPTETPLDWFYASLPDYYLTRIGNGKDNFGILRTFYTSGVERSYKLKHTIFDLPSNMELGWRVYWERFIDDRQTGYTKDSLTAPDAYEGVYFRGSGDNLEILGTSQHYETTALSAFISESIETKFFTLRPGIRLEIFEQERVDRLQGSLYQDKTLFVVLPGVAFSRDIYNMHFFGGIHRGFTPPSSGALKILNFGDDLVEGSGLDLEAEKSWNSEFGLRGNNNLLDFEFAYFHLDIENLVAAGRGTKFNNLGKVVNNGIESRLSIALSELNFLLPKINLDYTYLNSEIIDAVISSNTGAGTINIGRLLKNGKTVPGKRLPYTPEHTINIGLEFQPIQRMSFRWDTRFVSAVYTDFENMTNYDEDPLPEESAGDQTLEALGIAGPIPEYNVSSISFSYQVNNSLKVFLSAKNIFDKIYIGSRLHSNPGQPDAGLSSGIIPGPRRQINLSFNYSFGSDQ
tara:strand:- start:1657 stop:3783 length:2127 start_codon:yes stop_codon:yes gene_type:complete